MIKFKRGLLFSISLIIVIISILIAVGIKSNYFIIKHVKVLGFNFVSENDVKILAKVEGNNIFLLKSSDVKGRIKQNKYIEDVSIKRIYPDTVEINIKEKKIRGMIKYKNMFINIDNNGRMVQLVNEFPTGKIPLIDGINLKEYVEEKDLFEGPPQMALIKALTIGEYKEYIGVVNTIDMTNYKRVVFKTNRGIDIEISMIWEMTEEKLATAYSVLNSDALKGKKGVLYIINDGTATFKHN